MKNSFLPVGDEYLKEDKAYWRPSQFAEGENRIRIVMKPISGHLDWLDKRPIRYRPECKPKAPVDVTKPVKKFWICYVWDYKREGLFVLEFTQAGIINALRNYACDTDYGDLTTYDIKITKKGTGKETEYFVTAAPPKPMDKLIQKALEGSPVNLHALYEGGDPWRDLEGSEAKETATDRELFHRIHLMLEKSPNKDALLKGFLTAYNLQGLIDASEEQLRQLEKRLAEGKQVIVEKK